jgi:general secretion pathway protein A
LVCLPLHLFHSRKLFKVYLKYYNLKKEPFHITPDPEFLYLSPSHKEALAAIIYGIEQKKGFVAIIGDVGVGKTTILRSYLDSAERKHLKIIYVFNARLTFEGLLKTIFQDLEIESPSSDPMEMVNKLYEVLIEEYKQGNSVVLVIDEAQNMPIETLENLRMLSNLETSKDKLIQIVLVGQNEFEESLNLNRLRQLKQRIAIRSRILPLTKTESLDYVKSRLQKAGSNHSSIFTNGALKNIINEANGIPRMINILCDNSLITGFGYQKKPVGVKIVKEVIADFRGNRSQSIVNWKLATVISVAIIATGIFVFSPHFKSVLNWFSMPQQSSEVNTVSKKLAEKPRERITISEDKTVSSKSTRILASNQPESIPLPQTKQTPDTSAGNFSKVKQTKIFYSDVNGRRTVRPKSAAVDRTKVVKEDDILTSLLEEQRGRTDDKPQGAIQKINPDITNPNLIYSGSMIVFPEPPPQGEANER